MFLLDTNVVSDLRRRSRMDAGLVAWASETPVSEMYMSVITIFELERGILLKSRHDLAGSKVLREWFDTHVLARFQGRILPVDISIAQRCAALHVPSTRPESDALIAATALVHGLMLITRNTRDFQRMGVPLMSPWSEHR